MRRVLILTQCFPPAVGGIENLMAGLAAALAVEGCEVRVLADGRAAADDSARGYRVDRFWGVKLLRRKRKAMAARRLAGQVDLIIADTWKSLEALRLPRGGPVVRCLAMGMEYLDPRPSKQSRIRAALAKADEVLAISRYTADLAKRYMAPGAAIRIVTPPINPQPEPSAAARAAIAERFPPNAAPLVVSLGRLVPRKGVDRVIEAMAALSAELPGAALAVAGDGEDRARLERLALKRGVGDRLTMLGRVSEDEKAALLARADLFAMPTRVEGRSVEGFGIVYLEAGWQGAPSLAGRDGGAADAVIDGETGLLCDGADLASVTESLRRLLGGPDALRRMGERAGAHARSQTWPRRVDEFLRAPDRG